MINYTKQAGATDVSVVIRIIDATDGTPETSVVFNTSGIDLEYRREGAASVDITEADLSTPALTDAHADGGFLHIGNGYYRLDLPDAACAAGVSGVLVHGTVTGMVVIGCYIELVAYNPADAVRLGLTALPNANADAAGGLPISDAGGLDVDALATELAKVPKSDSNVSWNATALASINGEVDTALSDYDGPTKAELDSGLGALNNISTAEVLAQALAALDTAITSPTAGSVWDVLSDLDAVLPASTLSILDAADVNAQVLDVLNTDTFALSSGVPGTSFTLVDAIRWLLTLSRNKITQTSSVQSLRNAADSGNIATASVSDDSTTFTRGQWS